MLLQNSLVHPQAWIHVGRNTHISLNAKLHWPQAGFKDYS